MVQGQKILVFGGQGTQKCVFGGPGRQHIDLVVWGHKIYICGGLGTENINFWWSWELLGGEIQGRGRARHGEARNPGPI